jgi:hypothetical protein
MSHLLYGQLLELLSTESSLFLYDGFFLYNRGFFLKDFRIDVHVVKAFTFYIRYSYITLYVFIFPICLC